MNLKFLLKFIAFLTCLVIGFIIITNHNDGNSNTQKDSGDLLSFNDDDIVTVRFGEQGARLNLEVARSEAATREGLMFRTQMDENNGMIFIFESEGPRTFWMKNTKLSLDIIYLDSEYEIVRIYNNTKSDQIEERYPSIGPAQYAIEVNAGWAENNNLQIGDKLKLLDQ